MPINRLPSLNALKAFEAAARLGSMNQAAQELHLTHGAISRQVGILEEQLGVSLFTKQGRGIQLTAAGRTLSASASEALQQLQQACVQVQQQAQQAPLVLTCSGSLLARWLIPRLNQLKQDLPDLELQIAVSPGDQAEQQAALALSLGFFTPPYQAQHTVYPLLPERMGVVFSPHWPQAAQLQQAPPQALLEHSLLYTQSRPQAWQQWAQAHDISPEALRLEQGFEHLYYLLEAAVAGVGIAIAPQLLVADDVAAKRLLAPWGFIETEACLALSVPPKYQSPHVQALVAWLQQALL